MRSGADDDPGGPSSGSSFDDALQRIPRAFLLMLTAYFTLETASLFLSWHWQTVIRMIVIAILSWRVTCGSRIAAYLLGGVMVIFGLTGAVVTYSSFGTSIGWIGVLAVALFASLAVYAFFSPALRDLRVATSKASRQRLD